MQNKDVIKFEKVSFKYDQDWILKDINLSILDKEFIGIVGPNGGGKTTLLKLMLGLLKPFSGKVVIGEELLKTISYVPQYIVFDKYLPISVIDVILMGFIGELKVTSPFFKKDHLKRAKEALRELNIDNLEKEKFGNLSGGQRQRVLIARALVSKPQILILDEPIANVDRETQNQILNLLESFNKENTVVMVSHNYDFIASCVTRVLCINRGIAIHPTRDVSCEHVSRVGDKLAAIDHSETCVEPNKK